MSLYSSRRPVWFHIHCPEQEEQPARPPASPPLVTHAGRLSLTEHRIYTHGSPLRRSRQTLLQTYSQRPPPSFSSFHLLIKKKDEEHLKRSDTLGAFP